MDNLIKRIISDYHTPLYVFSEDMLERQIKRIENIFGKEYKICFAVKANPFLVDMIDKYVDRLEACSPGEYSILKKNEISSNKIVYSGVNKSETDLKELYKFGFDGICTIESFKQWNYLNECSKKMEIKPRVLVRLSSGNQFGVSESDLRRIISSNLEEKCIDIIGIHFFSGTQKKNVDIVKEEIRTLHRVCQEIEEEMNFSIREIEYGLGLFVDYFSDKDDTTYLETVCNSINENLSEYEVTVELGRYISYSCGNYYTTVVDTKNNGDRNYAIVDGGIHHVSYYGQMLGIKVPKINHYSEFEIEKSDKDYCICGSLCSVNDILIKRVENKVNLGDVFEFTDVGAYSCTENIALFLSRDLPAILNLTKDGLVLKRDHTKIYDLNG